MSKKQKQYSTEVRAYAHGYNDGRSVGIYSRVYDGFPKEEAAYAAGFEAGEQDGRPNRLKASGEYWEDNEPNWEDEDFPEHEGLDNQDMSDDYASATDLFMDMPEDDVAQRVVENWNLNDFQWEDNTTPMVAIQIVDGEVYEAFSTSPIRLYVVDENTDPGYIPEGLEIDQCGTLNYASKWARGNVQFEN